MMDRIAIKQQIDELRESAEGVQKILQVASKLLSEENPGYENLFALNKRMLYAQGQATSVGRDFDRIVEDVHQLARRQKCDQYNLVPYAKSITYRALHKDSEWEMKYDGDACHVVSEAVPYADTYAFSVKMASDTEFAAVTRIVALSNLVIDVMPEDEKRLNDFGLVSKRQLEKMDHIISIVEGLGRKMPKTPEEIFAKAFAKPFQTIYMEYPMDIQQGKLQKGAKLACHALHERFAEKLSAEQYEKLSHMAQKLSPVSLAKMWPEQSLAR